jgi:alkylation response protein AidB-like acyl-CoA dehydrogenase
VPLTETLLASYLLAAAGLDVPAGPMTIAPVYGDAALPATANGRFSGNVQRLPFAHNAQHAVCTVTLESGVGLALFNRNAWRVGEVAGAAQDIDADVTFDGAPVAIAAEGDWGDALLLMGAALRSQQMAGALAHILAQSSDYAQTRTQFGRAIVKFQAVQHNLAILAGEVAAASAAADAAMKTIIQYGLTDARTFMAVASAKIRTGEAANAGAAIAHQVHGAIGFTREYSLHHRTRRLWAWRDDFLPERVWAARLGQFVCDQGADGLWPMLTSI